MAEEPVLGSTGTTVNKATAPVADTGVETGGSHIDAGAILADAAESAALETVLSVAPVPVPVVLTDGSVAISPEAAAGVGPTPLERPVHEALAGGGRRRQAGVGRLKVVLPV